LTFKKNKWEGIKKNVVRGGTTAHEWGGMKRGVSKELSFHSVTLQGKRGGG